MMDPVLIELWQLFAAGIPVIAGFLLILARLKTHKQEAANEIREEVRRRANIENRIRQLEQRYEKHEEKGESHLERIYGTLAELKGLLADLKVQMISDHGHLSQRIAVLEQTGCDPIKKERSK